MINNSERLKVERWDKLKSNELLKFAWTDKYWNVFEKQNANAQFELFRVLKC